MSETIRAYWFCREDMTSPYAPGERWEIVQTRELEGEIVPRKWGFHGSMTVWDALQNATGPVLCLLELSGRIVFDTDLAAASEKTLVAAVNLDRELRLYAADCAERVLHIWEAEYPEDMRPRLAIQAARDYAHGRIDASELEKRAGAAWDAVARAEVAWLAEEVPAAAKAEAEAAGEAAAWAVEAAGEAAAWAVEAAVEAAVWGAAGAALDAADAAERMWQRTEFERRFGGLFQ